MRALRVLVIATVLGGCDADPLSRPVAPVSELLADVAPRAASWTLVNLGIDPNYVETVPTAINNRYLILGYSVDAIGNSRQFTQRLGGGRRNFGAGFVAKALNDHGVLAGSYNGAPAFWDSEQHVKFIPGVPSGSLTDISETGWVIGRGDIAGTVREFIWRPGRAQVRLLGTTSIAATVSSVNNAGYAAGTLGGRGGVWTPAGHFEPIPLPDTVLLVEPAEINDAGQVVGRAAVNQPFGGSSAFLWTKSQPMTIVTPNHLSFHYFASDVDRAGRMYATVRNDIEWYVSVWIGGAEQLLVGLFGGTHLEDVNDCGVAVGWDNGTHRNIPRLPRELLVWLTEC